MDIFFLIFQQYVLSFYSKNYLQIYFFIFCSILIESIYTVRIGLDVGGTNTDAVVVNCVNNKIIGFCKRPTTQDVITGILHATYASLNLAQKNGFQNLFISGVYIGTTQFVNAIVERKKLTQVFSMTISNALHIFEGKNFFLEFG